MVYPMGQASVVITWMVDWMVEMTFPIVEWSYHVTSMKESNVIFVDLYVDLIGIK